LRESHFQRWKGNPVGTSVQPCGNQDRQVGQCPGFQLPSPPPVSRPDRRFRGRIPCWVESGRRAHSFYPRIGRPRNVGRWNVEDSKGADRRPFRRHISFRRLI
jgi:hypothetical protein